jgi:hypothetical protein
MDFTMRGQITRAMMLQFDQNSKHTHFVPISMQLVQLLNFTLMFCEINLRLSQPGQLVQLLKFRLTFCELKLT